MAKKSRVNVLQGKWQTFSLQISVSKWNEAVTQSKLLCWVTSDSNNVPETKYVVDFLQLVLLMEFLNFFVYFLYYKPPLLIQCHFFQIYLLNISSKQKNTYIKDTLKIQTCDVPPPFFLPIPFIKKYSVNEKVCLLGKICSSPNRRDFLWTVSTDINSRVCRLSNSSPHINFIF